MTNKPLIVIPGDEPIQCKGSFHLSRLSEYGTIKLYENLPKTMDEQVERVKDATVIINSRSSVKWSKKTLVGLNKLKLIALCAIGTDAIDLDFARTNGISVANIPGKTAPIVAEHALGLMFAVAKRAYYQTASILGGYWTGLDNIYLGNKTLGIIGTGNIGSEMINLAKVLGMNVIAWTRNPTKERGDRLGVRYVDMDTLLQLSDVVSIHVALTPETFHLIGANELSRMKPGALIINVSRGSIIDQVALAKALMDGRIGGAGLDVLEDEPPNVDDPILQCENVVITPHVGDKTPEGTELLNEGVVDNVIAFLEGHPQNLVC
jgi:D-3-phosphoglycerate dehydrogenase